MKKLFLFVSLLIFTQISLGQETPRPKVGLVLSGGGAKGLAHIGVTKSNRFVRNKNRLCSRN